MVEKNGRNPRLHSLSGVAWVLLPGLLLTFAPPIAKAQERIVSTPSAQNGAYQPYQWKHVAIGAGGFITGYRSDAKGLTRVVRTDTYGAYIWRPDTGVDAPGRWAQLATSATMPEIDRTPRALNEGVYEIAVAPSNAKRIFMAIKGQMFRSDDAGKTFKNISDPTYFPLVFNPNGNYRFHGPFMAVSPKNPDLLLLGTPMSGLFRSENGGSTWQPIGSVPKAEDQNGNIDGVQAPGHVVVFGKDTAGRDVVYVMAPGHGLFVSTDDGITFTSANHRKSDPAIFKQGVFDGSGRFYVVDDQTKSVWRFDGTRWSDLTSNPGLQHEKFASIAVDTNNGYLYVFTLFGKTFLSTDAGATWKTPAWSLNVAIGKKDPPWLAVTNQGFPISQVVPDPVQANRFWASAGTGVYYADIPPNTVQVTWTSMSRGIEQLVSNDVYQAPGRAPLFAVWDFGIHRKEDLDTFSTGFGPIERMIISAQQVVGTPSDPDFAVTNASDHRKCCTGDGNTIMAGFSLDAGRTWSKFSSLPTPPGTQPSDPWRMSFGMIAVSSNDRNNIVWVPSDNKAPFYTKDMGKSWTQIRFPGEHGDFTGSHAAFYMPRRVLTPDPVDGGTFYLVHSGNDSNKNLEGLWVTRNAGEDWTKVFAGEIAPLSRFSAKLRAVPKRRGDLFFTSVVDSPIDTTLRRSRDGGVTWQLLPGIDRVDDIAFGKPLEESGPPTMFLSGYVKGAYGIWRSVDDAASWTRIAQLPVGTLDQAIVMAGDPDTFGKLYIGYMGSGWLYGAPASCNPKPYGFGDTSECFRTGQ